MNNQWPKKMPEQGHMNMKLLVIQSVSLVTIASHGAAISHCQLPKLPTRGEVPQKGQRTELLGLPLKMNPNTPQWPGATDKERKSQYCCQTEATLTDQGPGSHDVASHPLLDFRNAERVCIIF